MKKFMKVILSTIKTHFSDRLETGNKELNLFKNSYSQITSQLKDNESNLDLETYQVSIKMKSDANSQSESTISNITSYRSEIQNHFDATSSIVTSTSEMLKNHYLISSDQITKIENDFDTSTNTILQKILEYQNNIAQQKLKSSQLISEHQNKLVEDKKNILKNLHNLSEKQNQYITKSLEKISKIEETNQAFSSQHISQFHQQFKNLIEDFSFTPYVPTQNTPAKNYLLFQNKLLQQNLIMN